MSKIPNFQFKTRTSERIILKAFGILLFSFLFPCLPAHADGGVYLIQLVWPGTWVLLFPIILLEAFVALVILKISYWKAFKISGLANLVSTLVGIPVTCILSWVFSILIGRVINWDESTDRSFWGQLYQVTIGSPFFGLGPKNTLPMWMYPVSFVSMIVFFYFMSVWVEYLVAKVYTRKTYDAKLLLKWSWIANSLSYGFPLFVFLCWWCFIVIAHK